MGNGQLSVVREPYTTVHVVTAKLPTAGDLLLTIDYLFPSSRNFEYTHNHHDASGLRLLLRGKTSR